MLGKKGHKILTFKRAAAFLMSMCLLLGSSDFGLTLEAAENVSATFSEKLSEDGTSSEITMSVSAADQNTEILQIENPDGTVSGDASVTTYSVAENGTYEFTVTYQVNGEDESKETFSYIVSGIGKTEEGTAVTDENSEAGNATEEENIPDVAGEAGDGKDTNEAAGTETGNTGGVISAANGSAKAPRAAGDVTIDQNNFPDEVFRQYVSEKFDTDGNGTLSAGEISEIKVVNVQNLSEGKIKTLKGIEYFSELQGLFANENELTSLDLSSNQKLMTLMCDNNALTELTLATSVDIIVIGFQNNKLTHVTGEYNVTGMTGEAAGRNQKPELPVTYDSVEKVWRTADNSFGDGTTITTPGVTFVEDGNYVTFSDINIKESNFEWQGNGRLKVMGAVTFVLPDGIPITEEYFPDESFRNYLKSQDFGRDDNFIDAEELENIKEIDVSNVHNVGYERITTLAGIEYFYLLESLDCSEQSLSALDISKNTELKSLNCSYNASLESLDVSKNTLLEKLDCSACNIQVNVSNNNLLKSLSCAACGLKELDISQNGNLTYLDCSQNELEELDVSHNSMLTDLACYNNDLKSLDLQQNPLLRNLNFYANNLTKIDLTANTALRQISCRRNKLSYFITGGNTFDDYTGGTTDNQNVELLVTYDNATGEWRTEEDTFMPDTQFDTEGIDFVSDGNYITLPADLTEANFTWTLPENSAVTISGKVTFTYEEEPFRGGYITADEAQQINNPDDIISFGLYSGLSSTEEASIDVVAVDNFENLKAGELGIYNITYTWTEDGGEEKQSVQEITIVPSGSDITSNRDAYMWLPSIIETTVFGDPSDSRWQVFNSFYFAANKVTAIKEEKDNWYGIFSGYSSDYSLGGAEELKRYIFNTNYDTTFGVIGLKAITTYGEYVVTYYYPVGDEVLSITQTIRLVPEDGPISLVIIPSRIELGEEKNSQTVEASATDEISLVDEAQGENMYDVNVSADSTFQITNEEKESLDCVVYVNGTRYDGTGPLAVLNRNVVSQQFEIRALKSDFKAAGEFNGTMNFTVSYGE